MPYAKYNIGNIVEDVQSPSIRNPLGGTRIRVQVTESVPRTVFINLSNAPAETVNRFRELAGKVAMIPCREGRVDGNAFTSLEEGEIIELPPQLEVKPDFKLDSFSKPKL